MMDNNHFSTEQSMPYPTILVHVDDSAGTADRIRIAAQLAARARGHVIGAAPTGVSRFLYQSIPVENNDATLALHLDMLREQSRSALAAFQAQCDTLHVASFEGKVIDDEAGAGMCLHARAADLVIIGQATPGAADFTAHVIEHAGRPVLLVPATQPVDAVGRRVLVAWDGGREAARALQLALPLLKGADEVDIAVFEVTSDEQKVADALTADPRPWLARHGITASLAIHPVKHHLRLNRRHEVGERLLALATEGKADLLVMGAYGRSRLRESLVGGVTRTVLQGMTLPVLMGH